jgi:TPR repeat protein
VFGVCYHICQGVEVDEAKAVQLLRQAAEQGLAEAQVYLGTYHAYDTAVWQRRGCGRGH